MQSILTEHARRYPEWALDDLYKLIHQAAMGSEHALRDESAARESLAQELDQADGGTNEPLVDPISPDGRIVRVHLRPFARLALRQESLLQAFIRTAKEIIPSVECLGEYAAAAGGLAEAGMLGFARSQLAAFLSEMQAHGYPAVHHSPAYERLYRPAYRIVAREFLPGEIVTAGRTIADAASVNRRIT